MTIESGYDRPVKGFLIKYGLGVALPVALGLYALSSIVAREGTLYVPLGRREIVKLELTGTDAVVLGVFYASLALYIFSQCFFRHATRQSLIAVQGVSEFVSLPGIGISLIWLTVSLWREVWLL